MLLIFEYMKKIKILQSPASVTKQYQQVIGYPSMMPYWALGYQICKYGYPTITELKKVVEGMRSYGIPYDIQYGDIDYMDRQVDFTVDPINYVGLQDYVRKMREEYGMRNW